MAMKPRKMMRGGAAKKMMRGGCRDAHAHEEGRRRKDAGSFEKSDGEEKDDARRQGQEVKKPQKSLKKWSDEKWGTKSGKPSTQGSKATGERYLPKKARDALSPAEYAATSKAKREGTRKGKQFVAQPKKIAKKTARYRK